MVVGGWGVGGGNAGGAGHTRQPSLGQALVASLRASSTCAAEGVPQVTRKSDSEGRRVQDIGHNLR